MSFNLPLKHSIFVDHALFRLPNMETMYLVYDPTLTSKHTRRKNCIKISEFCVICYLDDLFLTKEKTYKRKTNENLVDFLIRFEKEVKRVNRMVCHNEYLISKRMIKKIKKMIPVKINLAHSISFLQLITK